MILLFNPPAPSGRGFTREGRCTQESGVWGTQWPPLTLATAAALLRKNGFEAVVRDYPASGLRIDDLLRDLQSIQPDIVVWSTGTPTLFFDLSIALLIRKHCPDALTAVMGTHVTALPEKTLKSQPALHVIIRGEPEAIILELARKHDNILDIKGISWIDVSGVIHHNPDAAPLSPDTIPAPDWDGIDFDAYRLPLKGRRFLMVAPVRGCPYQCTFCTAPLYYGARLRKRPVAQVIEEIEDNKSRHGIKESFIWADTFTADRAYVHDFCRTIIKKGLDVSWTCNSRVDTIDEKTLQIMKEAGLWMISFGLESGNDPILRESKKGITVVQSRMAVEMAHRVGIKTAGHFIFGLPGETRQTMQETLDFALSLPLDIAQFYAAAPFPGTALYDRAMNEGWIRNVSVNSETSVSQSGAAMELPGLSSETVDSFRRYAFRRFYQRPSSIGHLIAMVEPGAVFTMLPSGRRFRQWIR